MSKGMCAAPGVRGRRGHGAPGKAHSHTQELAALVEHGLFDHMIRSCSRVCGDRQPERLGGLEVDDQFELRRLLKWQVRGFAALVPNFFFVRRTTGIRF